MTDDRTRCTHCWHVIDTIPTERPHGPHAEDRDPPLQATITLRLRCCWCAAERVT
jgi:hypothetical protein